MLKIAAKSLRYNYVKVESIQQLERTFRNSEWYDGVVNKLKIGKFLMAEGYKDMKSDIKLFYANSSKQLGYEDNQKAYEVKNNLWKLGPIAILFCLPGGLPLILGYIALLPTLTPTWYLTNDKQSQLQAEKAKRKREALNFFINSKSIQVKQNSIISHINTKVFQNQSLLQKKKVHELCFGEYRDGTSLVKKTFGLNFGYLFSPSLSHFILSNNLEVRLRGYPCHGSSQDYLESKIIQEASQILQNENIFSAKID